MSCQWYELKKSFENCFDKKDYTFKSEEKTYVWAAPQKFFDEENKSGCIHYELVKRGDLYFIEFHIETNNPTVLVTEIKKTFNTNGNVRRWKSSTYYSSKLWQSRNPVFCKEDVIEDVNALKTVLGKIGNEYSSGSELEKRFVDKLKECHCFTVKLPELATSNAIHLPNVQRGFVWNPARCATLWDSILRKFPIGSICLQIKDNNADLLDGQQRMTAIKLAFSKFAGNDSKKQSVLWLELNPSSSSEKQFIFKVTTASQPWGYKDNNKETENPIFSIAEKRKSVEGYEWHDNNNDKPYPYELFPFQSELPVPFTLLREWIWEKNNSWHFNDFKEYCKDKLKNIKFTNWLKFIENKFPNENTWNEIIKAVQELKDYEIVVTNANNVSQNDIALFFARIGRGGVMPSEEEIAYSILKSKIGDENFDFKRKIEEIAKNGYAPPHRIASLMIRCFCSQKNEFCRTSIFSEVQKICQKEDRKNEFIAFIDAKGYDLFNAVVKALSEIMHKWHISRYCNYANGNIFLYLLLSYRDQDDANPFDKAIRVAEYVHCFSNDPGRVFNYIRNTNIYSGIIKSLGETYYGSPILQFPILPDAFPENIDNFELLNKLLNNQQNQAATNLLKYGYNKANMYSILLFACKGSLPQEYDPYLEEWKDDVCPWDYDHILPRSWFDEITNTPNANLCIALKDSIGNLAPLDFSLNRSLSDADRPKTYPKEGYEQASLSIEEFNGYEKDEFVNNQATRLYFCQTTIQRFMRMYKTWYEAFRLDFKKIIENSPRYKLFQKIKNEDNGKIYYVDGELQYEIKDNPDENLNLNWLRPWLAVGFEVNYNGDVNKKCLLSIASDGNRWEVGYRRHPQATEVNGDCNRWWFYCDKVFDNPKDAEIKFQEYYAKESNKQ